MHATRDHVNLAGGELGEINERHLPKEWLACRGGELGDASSNPTGMPTPLQTGVIIMCSYIPYRCYRVKIYIHTYI